MGYSELLYAFWKENMATQNLIWYGFGRDFVRFSPKTRALIQMTIFLSLIGNMSEKVIKG